MANAATIEIAREVRRNLAGQALTARQAKLYSQRLRLDMGREGLASFVPSDVDSYIDDAMLLLQCGLLERSTDPTSRWGDSIKRAAEIIEWLSQSSLKPPEAPLHLLAAAAYQLANYPAMALGHLRRVPDDQPFSVLLREFLRADFPAALESVLIFWRSRHAIETAGHIEPFDLTAHTFQHVVMCIGTVCTYLRTGNDIATERALTKLEKLADILIHSRDPYSYLLAQLTAASCRRFVESCLWPQVNRLRDVSSVAAGEALIQFARSTFTNRRALVWPAQVAGIEHLRTNTSFVLCTPTGSGKTTIATLAIVQSLFADAPHPIDPAGLGPGNLVLYLVPSRALAAEIESRLAQDLNRITAEPIVVTGLYGGIDWGPTDTWIQTDGPTIVICTFEKADALLRYLGILFLDRVRLVVIDEAHMVEQDEARLAGLEDGSSRSYRLEQLGTRLLRARSDNNFRIIALSAVAARAAPALTRWIDDTPDASPITSTYRSTRQMLGRLEVTTTGQYTIRYNLMDGQSLRFEDERRPDTPFVRYPFPPFPDGLATNDGPDIRMRGPTLWAALHLATERPDGSKPSVLISLTQNVEAFTATCANLMDRWSESNLPNYWAIDSADDLWYRCLASAADYFTVDSVEYRLLQRGIAVHHGKMPGLLARRLKTVIDRGYVRVIIATSTLSEGVNIPVNFLLIPSLYRSTNPLSLHEFTNLIGRAGRPGTATEGSALVVLPDERTVTHHAHGRTWVTQNRQWAAYERRLAEIEETTTAATVGAPEDQASSPLAHLLDALKGTWSALTDGGSQEEFVAWLEHTAVIGAPIDADTTFGYLDSLDAFLIAAIQEVEELRHGELAADQIEAELTAIWRRSYAFAATHNEARLLEMWLVRGRAIKTLYPNSVQRRRIYKTSLSPRSATTLISLAGVVLTRFQDGAAYARWTSEERFTFVRDILAFLSQIQSFRIETTLGRNKNFQDWPKLLRWWLAKATLAVQPAPNEITDWYDFVSKNFIYRGAWGLGSIIGLLLDTDVGERPIRALEIDDWPRSGLPWIAFWMKDLITWGTLDPVAAFLLARGNAVDRIQAETDAQSYYDDWPQDANPNDMLDPRQIREWVGARRIHKDEAITVSEIGIEAVLERSPSDYLMLRLPVTPIDVDGSLLWIDPGGYTVARTEIPINWPGDPSTFDFELDVSLGRIVGSLYLKYDQKV
jgi:superfamily II DNA/RNA helicase